MIENISFNTEEIVKESIKDLQPKFNTYELLPENAEILKEVMPEFDFSSGVDTVKLASELVETAMKHEAFGLSANQCGLRYRVFVMGAGEEYLAFFNPKIISKSDTENYTLEGCLSFPCLTLNILRANKIEVEYQDFQGNTKTSTFEGMSARIFQHELDHLNGITFVQKAKPMALKLGKTKREKYYKKIARGIAIKNLKL